MLSVAEAVQCGAMAGNSSTSCNKTVTATPCTSQRNWRWGGRDWRCDDTGGCCNHTLPAGWIVIIVCGRDERRQRGQDDDDGGRGDGLHTSSGRDGQLLVVVGWHHPLGPTASKDKRHLIHINIQLLTPARRGCHAASTLIPHSSTSQQVRAACGGRPVQDLLTALLIVVLLGQTRLGASGQKWTLCRVLSSRRQLMPQPRPSTSSTPRSHPSEP